jgi:hypothetical protein
MKVRVAAVNQIRLRVDLARMLAEMRDTRDEERKMWILKQGVTVNVSSVPETRLLSIDLTPASTGKLAPATNFGITWRFAAPANANVYSCSSLLT